MIRPRRPHRSSDRKPDHTRLLINQVLYGSHGSPPDPVAAASLRRHIHDNPADPKRALSRYLRESLETPAPSPTLGTGDTGADQGSD